MSRNKTRNAIYFTPTSPASRHKLYRIIRGLGAGVYSVDLAKQRNTATKEQRGYYWGYIIPKVAQLLKLEREQADRLLCSLLLWETWQVEGESVMVVRSTSDLSPDEAEAYYAKIRKHAWAKWQLEILDPGRS